MEDQQLDIVTALSGRYDIERELGSGGMAVVYLAEDVRHKRQVAVKVLRPELTAAGEGAERFLREIEIVAGLTHPHLVPLYDSGRAGDVVFFVMPYLEGETLRERLDREGVLPVDDAVAVIRDIASALDYAHGRGVVHRDVKPSNVMLTKGGAMLADFGVAVAVQRAKRPRITEQGISVGTAEYMSPEQATGSDAIDARSDVYALGCVAYELLAGEPPFTGSSAQAIVARHLGAPPPDVGLLRPSLPAKVSDTLQRALAKQAADRFQSAGELADAVEAAVEGGGVRPVGASWWPATSRSRRLSVAGGLAATAVVVAVVAGVLLLGRSAPAPTLPAPVPRQLTFEGDVRQAYGSPDGSLLAYEIVRDDTYRLFVAEGDGGSPVEIYRTEDFACCPAWSPDGTRILLRSGPRTAGRGLVIPRRGGDARSLPTDVVTAWSPAGDRVVGWWPATDTLRFVDTATGEPAGSLPLAVPHDWVNGVHWSPDGRLLAVATAEADSASSSVLWTLPVDGGPPRAVFRDAALVMSPHWAADGGSIYFLRDGQDVWKVPVDGGEASGEPVRLAAGLSPHVFNATMPVFTVSEDGDRLHYARWEGRANLLRVELSEATEGATVDTRWLTSGTAERREPRISPDGESVAFLRQAADGWNLWIRPFDGEARRITYFDGLVASPTWSPDGRRLAFGGARGEERGIWVVSLDGGAASRVGGEGYGGNEVVWLADGRILYQTSGDRRYGLLGIDGDTATIEAPEDVWLYGPRGSPDGRRVAFRGTGNRGGLWLVRLEDGAWTRISERSVGPVAWSTAGDTVYAMPSAGRGGPGSRELLAIPSDGGEARRVARLPEGVTVNPWNVSFRPDEGILVGAVFNSSVDAWVLEGFDPSG